GREMRELWKADGRQTRTLRPVSRLLRLPRVQNRQANFHWRRVPGVQAGLPHRATQPEGQDFLRMQPISGVQVRLLEPAAAGSVPLMSVAVFAAEILQDRGRLHRVPQQRLRLPARAGNGNRDLLRRLKTYKDFRDLGPEFALTVQRGERHNSERLSALARLLVVPVV